MYISYRTFGKKFEEPIVGKVYCVETVKSDVAQHEVIINAQNGMSYQHKFVFMYKFREFEIEGNIFLNHYKLFSENNYDINFIFTILIP